VNLTPKYLPFLCLYYRNPCALLLTGGIWDRDVIVVCILRRLYIFLELETMNFIKLAAICTAVILCDFHKSVPCFFAIFLLWFSTVPMNNIWMRSHDAEHFTVSTEWATNVICCWGLHSIKKLSNVSTSLQLSQGMQGFIQYCKHNKPRKISHNTMVAFYFQI